MLPSRPTSWQETGNPLRVGMETDWREQLVQDEMACLEELGVGNFVELYGLLEHMPPKACYDLLTELGVSARGRVELLYALEKREDASKSPAFQPSEAVSQKGPLSTPMVPLRTATPPQKRASVALSPTKPKYGYWVQEVPLLNVLYDATYSRTPDFESVRSSMRDFMAANLLGLVLVASFVNGVDYDELTAFIERADLGRVYYGCRNRGKLTYKSLTRNAVTAYAFLGASFFSVTVFLIFTGNTSFSNTKSRRVWWRYSSGHLLVAALSNVIGMAFAFLTFIDIFLIKFPDYWILDHADECTNGRDWPMEPKSAWGFCIHMLTNVIYPTVGASVVILSLAVRGKYRAERGLPDCSCFNQQPRRTLKTTSLHSPDQVVELAQSKLGPRP